MSSTVRTPLALMSQGQAKRAPAAARLAVLLLLTVEERMLRVRMMLMPEQSAERSRFHRLVEHRDLFLARGQLHGGAAVGGDQDRGDGVAETAADVLRLFDLVPALVGAVGVHECRLGDVLGISRISKQGQRVAVDVRDVLAVQLFERPIPR